MGGATLLQLGKRVTRARIWFLGMRLGAVIEFEVKT